MFYLVLFATCLLIYRYITRNHDYWDKRNVKHDRPLPFFGNHLPNIFSRRTQADIGIEMYNKFKGEKIVGYFRGTTPELILRDPEIVRHILSVDFKNFADRKLYENAKKDPLLQNIVFADVKQWQIMRPQLTGGFTKSKMTKMYPQILKCVADLQTVIEKYANQGEVVTAYDLMVRFTLQCISTCGLGVELTTMSKQSKFSNLAKKFFVKTKLQMFLMAMTEIIPAAKFLFNYVKIIDPELESKLIELTENIIQKKKMYPNGNRDFMDIFFEMAAQKNGINSQNMSETEIEKANLQFLASQLFFFLFTGFETSATAMGATLFQLAHHPDIQLNIQKQIDSVLSKNENKLMDSIEEITELDIAFRESLRLLSPVGSIRRTCMEPYTIPGTNVSIDPGIKIFIPIQAIHLDSEYYEHPKEFRPERFAINAEKISNHTYLVFGDGPRKCIGYKLALKMAYAGLASILRHYTVMPASDDRQLHIKKTSYLTQIVEGGMPIKFIPREHQARI